jgi:hypothetical protein
MMSDAFYWPMLYLFVQEYDLVNAERLLKKLRHGLTIVHSNGLLRAVLKAKVGPGRWKMIRLLFQYGCDLDVAFLCQSDLAFPRELVPIYNFDAEDRLAMTLSILSELNMEYYDEQAFRVHLREYLFY